jgi:hypothetical protein
VSSGSVNSQAASSSRELRTPRRQGLSLFHASWEAKPGRLCFSAAWAPTPASFASPKSSTLTTPCDVILMLAGLRFRIGRTDGIVYVMEGRRPRRDRCCDQGGQCCAREAARKRSGRDNERRSGCSDPDTHLLARAVQQSRDRVTHRTGNGTVGDLPASRRGHRRERQLRVCQRGALRPRRARLLRHCYLVRGGRGSCG